MTTVLASQAADARAKGDALIRTAEKLLCESWNERIWADGDGILMTGSSRQAMVVASAQARLKRLKPIASIFCVLFGLQY